MLGYHLSINSNDYALLFRARIRRLMIGVDRTTAAEFGFDDEFFYQELDQPKHERSVKHLEGIMKDKVTEVS